MTTIAKVEANSDNIFKIGNVVQYKRNKDLLILVTSKNKSQFCGTQITKFNDFPIGTYYETWEQSDFEQFKGKITLEVE